MRTDESCPLLKFADDTELVGKISNDEDAMCQFLTKIIPVIN